MSEFTAGPYECDSDGHIYPEVERDYDDEYSPHIAKVNNRTGFEGNKRLLRAAPEMYEALMELRSTLMPWNLCRVMIGDARRPLADAFMSACDLLAKIDAEVPDE